MFDVFNKKHMYDDVITGKENVSQLRGKKMHLRIVVSMYLTSLISILCYACSICICLKTAIWLLGVCWYKVWILLEKTGWQP